MDEETTETTEQTETTETTAATTETTVERPEPQDDPRAENERLRLENARLQGELAARREPTTAAKPEPAPATTTPYEDELKAIKADYAAGAIDDATYHVKLSRLGTRMEWEEQEKERLRRDRRQAVVQHNSQKISAYMQRYPGLADPNGADMRRVQPHLHAVCEEMDLQPTDPRAQALALERAYGPLTARNDMPDHREFERRRHPVGGVPSGGGGEEAPKPKEKSKGERIFDRLLPEFQQFYITTRGSREAAVKTLEYADEHLMRKQGRFAT